MNDWIWLALIPINILILNIWIWLFKNIFDIQKNKTLWITILLGVISGLSIFFYEDILMFFSLSEIKFTDHSNITDISPIIYFRAYLSLIIFIVRTFISKLKITNFFVLNYTIFSVLFIWSWFLTNQYPNTPTFLIYYIFVAFGEEFIKYLFAINIFDENKITDDDIILFCILSAIGFAFIENIVYLYNWVQWETIINTLAWWTWILISRWLIWFLVHIIFTWNIGLITKPNNKNLIPKIALGILIGSSLHYWYNVWLHNWYQIIILIALIVWYIWISYLFYNSDRLYIREWLKI